MDDLISRQASIDKLKSIITDREHTSITDEAKERAAREFFADIPSSAQQWIPCSERLPEESGEYLITGLHHSGELWIEVDKFDKDGGNSPYQWWRFDEKVIAWMPLPEPYKAESEGKE